MLLPTAAGDYTDFYASIHHATNVGKMFRPDNPLLPNYKHVPIAYHGRSSSLVVSGATVTRPNGQLAEGKFGPSRELDYEVELGAIFGPGNDLGAAIPIAEAQQHIAGVCLVNDWSARDIQRWEYQPLGPFLAKNFATSVSPWLVTMEALAPFRTRRAAARRARSFPTCRRRGAGGVRHHGRGVAAYEGDDGAGADQPGLVQGHVLDPGADGRAPHLERLHHPTGRPHRQRHHLRARRRRIAAVCSR